MCERRRGYAITHYGQCPKCGDWPNKKAGYCFVEAPPTDFCPKLCVIVEPRSFGELRMRGSAEQGYYAFARGLYASSSRRV